LQAKLLLGERINYLLRRVPQAGAWGEIYVPKQELGNEGRGDIKTASRGPGLIPGSPLAGPKPSWGRLGGSVPGKLIDKKALKKVIISKLVLILSLEEKDG
jgi:hypothetical protein